MATRIWYGLLILSLAVVLAGCGGGGGGSDEPGVTLTIGADTLAGTKTLAVKTRAVDLTAPLPQGSTVIVYDFKTGAEITRGTLDATGTCKLTVTPGLTVAVVVTGTLDGKDYRLSLLIPQVPSVDTEYVANPVTSLAAEAIAAKHFKKGVTIDQSTLDEVTDAAYDFYSSDPQADYSVGGGVFAGASFGTANSLTSAAQAVFDTVPSTINQNLVAAKNAVQTMKEAGIPLQSLFDQEYPDAQGIFTEAVLDKYCALSNAFGQLIGPAIFGDLSTETESDISIFELELGKAYTVTDPDILLVSQTGTTDSNKIRITMTADGATLTVVATKASNSWTVKQTSSADSAMAYTVTLTDPQTIPETNPSANVTVSLKDQNFPTTGITFSGTVSATGENPYSKFSFNGNLASPQATMSGAFSVSFPSSVPAGADPGDQVYEWPTSASLSNGSITVTGGGKTLSFTGGISIETVVYQDDEPALGVKSVEMTGNYKNNNSKVEFKGSITGAWTNAPTIGNLNAKGTLNLHGELTRTGYPTQYADITFKLSGGQITADIDLRVGAHTLTGTASATLDADGHLVGTSTLVLINQAGVKFSLSRNASGEYAGTIRAGSPEEKVADISKSGSLLRIDYIDSTFEEFPL
ncbi:MAG: hypothetical protein ACPL7O_00990 [Armatimonadota bacterium]